MSRYHNDILATCVQIDTPDFEFRTRLVIYVHCASTPINAVVRDGGAHAALLLDQAGWHMTDSLAIPANITLLPLPPKCPEFNSDLRSTSRVVSCGEPSPNGTQSDLSRLAHFLEEQHLGRDADSDAPIDRAQVGCLEDFLRRRPMHRDCLERQHGG